jgi:hypothetical protein
MIRTFDLSGNETTLDAGRLGSPAEGVSVRSSILAGGLSQGVHEICVDNGRFRFVVLPTRGMGLWKGWLGDLEIGWRCPVAGPVHPGFVPIAEPSGLGWLDGFDEWLVRCGLVSNGAPDFDDAGRLRHPLHGRIANRPAQSVALSVDPSTGEMTLTGVVEETRFLFHRLRLTSHVATRPGEPGLRITDVVENLSAEAADVQMLYHVNFGPPLLEAGSTLVAPIERLVPRDDRAAEGVEHWNTYGAPQPGYAEQVYFASLRAGSDGDTRVLLKNAESTAGASLQFAVADLRCFTLWKNTAAAADGYVTGLEPGTNFPNPRTHEAKHGRVVSLGPGETIRLQLAIEIHDGAAAVGAVEQSIAALAGDAPPQIITRPQPGWCVT